MTDDWQEKNCYGMCWSIKKLRASTLARGSTRGHRQEAVAASRMLSRQVGRAHEDGEH